MSMYAGASVLLFLKAPEKGKIKSRLASSVGDAIALNAYKCFVSDILATLSIGGYPTRIYYLPPALEEVVAQWLGDNYPLFPQTGNDLGERMSNAFSHYFSDGGEKALLIGSDIPDLPTDIIAEAFACLEDNDAVIGPAADGGYYLIGLKNKTFVPEIFHGIPWSTGSVFSETVKLLKDHNCRTHILPEWRDVDTRDDLLDLFLRNERTPFKNSATMSYLASIKKIIITGI